MPLRFQTALAFPRALWPCGSIPATQMGQQIERGPAIQSAGRELGVHDVTQQTLTWDWKHILIHQADPLARLEIGTKKSFLVLCIGENVGAGAQLFGRHVDG